MVHGLSALLLVFQWNLDYELLRVEDARADAAPLVEALSSPSPAVQRQALRALGRFERPELAPHVLPFASEGDVEIRIEAINALAQMKTTVSLAPLLQTEQDPHARAAIYEAMGRLPSADESTLLQGLLEAEVPRFGATKGLENYYRVADRRPSEEAIRRMRDVVRRSESEPTKRLALITLDRADDHDRETLEAALESDAPETRRLAVMGLGEWREDDSYLVRIEALKAGFDCERAEVALNDSNPHVALLAIDLLGSGCDPEPVERVAGSEDWRRSSHALVSLAQVDPAAARRYLPRFVGHPVWQARVYAARAAKLVGDETSLEASRSDSHPNVVAEALETPEQALAALKSGDYGLLMTSLGILEESGDAGGVTTLIDTLKRLTAEGKATSRDPRRKLIELISRQGSAQAFEALRPLASDFDPAIAALAASKADVPVVTERFKPDPLPPEDYIHGLYGARARIEMKEAGPFVIELLPEEAPLTVAQFARLAEDGYYDGLTFHRVVPNFVLQGGSPGANEYVGTARYLRDEVGRLSHTRGTLGISTRGRDTGDSQIFINLVDNYRLDHNYTVFARVVEGMDNVDRILEGDTMSSVKILRR
jgi:cyclophilin family peptidyl-prolyl cis-trans isomerase